MARLGRSYTIPIIVREQSALQAAAPPAPVVVTTFERPRQIGRGGRAIISREHSALQAPVAPAPVTIVAPERIRPRDGRVVYSRNAAPDAVVVYEKTPPPVIVQAQPQLPPLPRVLLFGAPAYVFAGTVVFPPPLERRPFGGRTWIVRSFSTADLTQTINLAGIASEEGLGSLTVVGEFTRILTGIASEEAIGTLTVTAGPVTIVLVGIASEEAIGLITVLGGDPAPSRSGSIWPYVYY